jgi:uncharacterized caspase-like protein
MQFIVRFLLLTCLALAGLPSAEARRVALVIGNSDYKTGRLPNPGNDATAVAGLLARIGFDKVLLRRDLDVQGFRSALLEMSREAARAEIALVYFAGRGTEVRGRNFLIPVDAVLAKAGDLDLEAIALEDVVSQLAGATKLKLVILDASRNDIFPLAAAKGARGRGLTVRRGEAIFYATKPGATADDGAGGAHSPFTAALLQHMGTPDIDVFRMMARVVEQVESATGGRQWPWVYGRPPESGATLVPRTAATPGK